MFVRGTHCWGPQWLSGLEGETSKQTLLRGAFGGWEWGLRLQCHGGSGLQRRVCPAPPGSWWGQGWGQPPLSVQVGRGPTAWAVRTLERELVLF